MTIKEYIHNRYEFLHKHKETTFMNYMKKSMDMLSIYIVQNEYLTSWFIIKVLDNSFFNEYYKRYMHLYDDKSYYIWYKTIFNPSIKNPMKYTLKKNKRDFIFKRDGYMCVVCKSKKKLTIDHLNPRCFSKDDSFYNLITMCSKCNYQKGNADWGLNFLGDVVIPHIKQVKNQ